MARMLKILINFDFNPHLATIRQANLLGRFSLVDNLADVVYSSHFLEHSPRDLVAGFLTECHRIMALYS